MRRVKRRREPPAGPSAGTPARASARTATPRPRPPTRPPDDANAVLADRLARGAPFELEWVARIEVLPDYVVRNPDQELWLQLVPALNFELTSTVTCFHAMVRHPQCENAVAAALLQQMRAPEFMSLPREDTQRFAASEMELIDAIIRRDGTKGFPSAGCGDAAWVNRAKLRSHLPEIRLLAVTPTGRPPRQRYIVDEDGVSRVV